MPSLPETPLDERRLNPGTIFKGSLYDEAAAAHYLTENGYPVVPGTLRQWRAKDLSKGPRPTYRGRFVRYRQEELDAFLHRITSPSPPIPQETAFRLLADLPDGHRFSPQDARTGTITPENSSLCRNGLSSPIENIAEGQCDDVV